MRKVLLTLLATGAVALTTVPAAQAVDMKGKWGPGVSFDGASVDDDYIPAAPLDVKFGLSPKSSVFFNLGLVDAEGDDDTDFVLGGGFEYALFGSSDYNFNLQPSIEFYTGGASNIVRIPLALSAEVWMNDRVSVQASHGIAINIIGDNDNTLNVDEGGTSIGTFGASVTSFRFRFYVK